jgi:hypothetical protein
MRERPSANINRGLLIPIALTIAPARAVPIRVAIVVIGTVSVPITVVAIAEARADIDALPGPPQLPQPRLPAEAVSGAKVPAAERDEAWETCQRVFNIRYLFSKRGRLVRRGI